MEVADTMLVFWHKSMYFLRKITIQLWGKTYPTGKNIK
jgi:hypothetical protein